MNMFADLQALATAFVRKQTPTVGEVTPELVQAILEVFGREGDPTNPQIQAYVRDLLEHLPKIMERAHVYAFPKADVIVDSVVFGLDFYKGLQLLLIQRGREGEPHFGEWTLPGGFLEMEEKLEESAARKLKEEMGFELSHLEQLYTFGDPNRDPRGRVLSVAYMGIVRPSNIMLQTDNNAAWHPITNLPPLAFDHAEIIQTGLSRLRGSLRRKPVGVWLLPDEFPLQDLQKAYEILLGEEIHTSSFRKRIQKQITAGVIKPTIVSSLKTGGRPAQLYTFDDEAYRRLREEEGFEFKV